MASLKSQLTNFRRIILILIVAILILAFIAIRQGNATIDLPTNIFQASIRDVERVVSSEGNLVGIDEREVYLVTGTKIAEVRVTLNQSISKDTVLAVLESINALGVKAYQDIKSPIGGVVAEINYKVGDVVTGISYGFKVIDTSTFIVKSEINESDIIFVKKDQKVDITVPAISLDTKYPATVTLVSSVPFSSAGGVVNYLVEIKPESLPSEIRSGMSVDLDILTEKVEDVIAVPESYLIEKENKFFVKVLAWKNAEKTDFEIIETEITFGLRTNEYVEIKEGLPDGTEIAEPEFKVNTGFGFFGN